MKSNGLAAFVYIFLTLKVVYSVKSGDSLETCSDEKQFKALVKTKPNLLIIFSKSNAGIKDTLRLLREVNVAVKSFASVAHINCDDAKKLCKKLKISPESFELKHYSDGVFNKDYDRQIAKKSFINFLKDPKGDIPWEEEESAADVYHIKNENDLNKLIKKTKVGLLIMFYAPWCGYCKKIKPDYSEAATELKPNAILAAMDVDKSENYKIKITYNITGFPTILFFKNGNMEFPYGGEFNKNGLIEWMKNPEPAKPKEPEVSWADEEDVHVTFLTTDTFDSYIETHKNVLVKFYAPWCGHCKNMKPIYNRVAQKLIEENSENKIAFVDATKETKLGERYKVKGYPTVKMFKDGKVAFDYSERDEQKILEFMRNPVEPPPKEEEPEWKDEPSNVVHAEESNFATLLKTKKHALAFFYAPWCGHCKNAKPHFANAAEHFKEDPKIAFIAVDCTKSNPLCEQHGVKGFPTIIYFNFGKNSKPYEGGRELKDFIKFMSNPSDPNVFKFDARDDWLDIPGNQHITFLDDNTFDNFIKEKKHVLVMFYAPWCGHCKSMKPAYGEAATELTSFVPGSYLAAVDATKTTKLNERFNIQGFPTIKYFEGGEFKFDYSLARNKESIVQFMRNPSKASSGATTNSENDDPINDWLDIPGHQHIHFLDDTSFDRFLMEKRKVLVLFYAPWCGHCKAMKPAYGQAASEITSFVPGSYLAAVDGTKATKINDRFKLQGYPTLKYFESGEFKFDYSLERTKEKFVEFMRNPKSPIKNEL